MDHYNSRETAEAYDRTFSEDSHSPELRNKATERFNMFISSMKPGSHILDTGCGTGRFVKYFIRKGFKVTGIDSSAAMIEMSEKNNPGIEFMVMDIRYLDFQPGTFDGIWNVATILHLDEKGVSRALQESRRVLKKDGILYIATRTGDKNICRMENSTEGGRIIVNYYTQEKLQELLIKNGFKIQDIKIEKDDLSRPFDYAFVLARSQT